MEKVVYARLNKGGYEAVAYKISPSSLSKYSTSSNAGINELDFYKKVKDQFIKTNVLHSEPLGQNQSSILGNYQDAIDINTPHLDNATIVFAQKIGLYKMFFPDAFKKFTTLFDRWPPQMPTRVVLGTFDTKFYQSQEPEWKQINGYWASGQKDLFYHNFLFEFQQFILDNLNFFSTLSYSTDRGILISELTKLNQQVYGLLSPNHRDIILDILLNGDVDQSGVNEEQLILNLLENFENTDDRKLKAEEILNNLKKASHFTSDKTILEKAIDKIDDSHIGYGDDNYRALILAIAKICYSNPKFYSIPSNLTPKTLPDYSASYNYESFYARLWKTLAAGITDGFYAPTGLQTDVDLAGNTIKVTENMMQGFVTLETLSSKDYTSPFDPVILINNANLPLTKSLGYSVSEYKTKLEALQKGDKTVASQLPFIPVPVLLLKYIDDKVSQEILADAVSTAMDVATLMTGVGPIISATSKFRKVCAVMDMVGAGVSVSGNLMAEMVPNENAKEMVKNFSNATSTVFGVIGLSGELSGMKLTASAKYDDVASEMTAVNERSLTTQQLEDYANSIISTDLKQVEMSVNFQKANDALLNRFITEAEAAGDVKLVGKLTEARLKFADLPLPSTVKKLDNVASSVPINWGDNLDDKYIVWADPKTNILSTAKTFANETGSSLYDNVFADGTYVKFDIADGRILLGTKEGAYHAFAVINETELKAFRSSIVSADNELFNSKLSSFLFQNTEKLKVLSGVVSKPIVISGKSTIPNSQKVSTMLGRFRPDISDLFTELGSYKNVGLGENVGGLNLLNKPDYYYDAATWWTAYNKPWLERAIGRGDDIYLATIPTSSDQLWTGAGKLNGAFAQEVDLLTTKNYKPTNLTTDQWINLKIWLGKLPDKDNFVINLPSNLKSTYHDLVSTGLIPEFKANSILLRNTSGETVAIIYNNKLTPVKWKWAVRAPKSYIQTLTDEGYIVISNGDQITIDLGFKEGRKLTSEEVNDYLVNGQGKDKDGQPYWAGTEVDEIVLKEGEILYFVENYNNKNPKPGSYASKDPISTIKELREKLAVKEAWKPDEKTPTLRTYQVKTQLRVRTGAIGPQVENGVILPGGGHQYEIYDDMYSNWEKLVEIVGSSEGIILK